MDSLTHTLLWLGAGMLTGVVVLGIPVYLWERSSNRLPQDQPPAAE